MDTEAAPLRRSASKQPFVAIARSLLLPKLGMLTLLPCATTLFWGNSLAGLAPAVFEVWVLCL